MTIVVMIILMKYSGDDGYEDGDLWNTYALIENADKLRNLCC